VFQSFGVRTFVLGCLVGVAIVALGLWLTSTLDARGWVVIMIAGIGPAVGMGLVIWLLMRIRADR